MAAELTEDRIREIVREELAAGAVVLPTGPAAPSAGPPAQQFKIGFDGSIHTKGAECSACQSGYPMHLSDPPKLVTGFKEAPPAPAELEPGKHYDPPAPEPITSPDPRYALDAHAKRCDGLL